MDIGFEGFEAEPEEFEMVKVKKMDRHLRFGSGGSVLADPVLHEGVMYIVSADNHAYAIDAQTGEELWRFGTSDLTKVKLAPAHDAFEMRVKKEAITEGAAEEGKYDRKSGEETLSLSDYHVQSEYSTTSEYRQKSDYDTGFVIFKDVLEGENLPVARLELRKHLSPTTRK